MTRFPHATDSFGEKISAIKQEFPNFIKKLLCSMTDLHSTVPLTQGTVPGASFWDLVSGKFSANLSRAFSQFFLLLFWRRWTSSIEDGLPVPKPACVRRSWSWICYQKLRRELTVVSKHTEICYIQFGTLTIILWIRKDWCIRKNCQMHQIHTGINTWLYIVLLVNKYRWLYRKQNAP